MIFSATYPPKFLLPAIIILHPIETYENKKECLRTEKNR